MTDRAKTILLSIVVFLMFLTIVSALVSGHWPIDTGSGIARDWK